MARLAAPGGEVSVDQPLIIAILGAESTGKTTLAEQLTARIVAESGLRCTWVDEWLRRWCEEAGRTPRQDEQAAIAHEQARRIAEAAASHEVVVCDTTPLMTAVYSRWVFNDASLDAQAAAWQRRCATTLLTALDLPWVPDGLQREGPHVQPPVDTLLREQLLAHELPFAVVGGQGEARLQQAVDAVAPLLLRRVLGQRGESQREASGLFTRLASRNANRNSGREGERWVCEFCDDARCEQLTRASRWAAHQPSS